MFFIVSYSFMYILCKTDDLAAITKVSLMIKHGVNWGVYWERVRQLQYQPCRQWETLRMKLAMVSQVLSEPLDNLQRSPVFELVLNLVETEGYEEINKLTKHSNCYLEMIETVAQLIF